MACQMKQADGRWSERMIFGCIGKAWLAYFIVKLNYHATWFEGWCIFNYLSICTYHVVSFLAGVFSTRNTNSKEENKRHTSLAHGEEACCLKHGSTTIFDGAEPIWLQLFYQERSWLGLIVAFSTCSRQSHSKKRSMLKTRKRPRSCVETCLTIKSARKCNVYQGTFLSTYMTRQPHPVHVQIEPLVPYFIHDKQIDDDKAFWTEDPFGRQHDDWTRHYFSLQRVKGNILNRTIGCDWVNCIFQFSCFILDQGHAQTIQITPWTRTGLEGTHKLLPSLVVIEKQVGLDARRQSPFDWRNKFTLLFPQITSTYGSKVHNPKTKSKHSCASLSPTTIFHIVPQRSNPFQQRLGFHLCCRGSSTARSCCCTRLLRSNSDFSESQSLNGHRQNFNMEI